MGKGDPRADAAKDAASAVADVRDNPEARIGLLDRLYGSDEDWCCGERAFMEWEKERGVLNPPDGSPPGSPWWRAVNEQLLRDAMQARLLSDQKVEASRGPVTWWMAFFDQPTAQSWYRAHNSSVIAGYLSAAPLALDENDPEQKLMSVVLTRVLYAQLLQEHNPDEEWPFKEIGKFLADPREPGIEAIVHVADFYPRHYPLDPADGHGFHHWLRSEFDKLANEAMRIPRLQELYSRVATILRRPRLNFLAFRGMPTYPWGALVPEDEIERLRLSFPAPAALLTELRRLALVHR